MSDVMLAYCGIACGDCPAYKVKRTGDMKLAAETAEKWSSPGFPVTADEISCDSCKSADGTHFKFCADCPVRECASSRGVITCAHCEDYGCDILEAFFSQMGDSANELRQRLSDIRDSL